MDSAFQLQREGEIEISELGAGGCWESVCGVERESETERARESRGGYGDSHLWSRSSFPKLLLHL